MTDILDHARAHYQRMQNQRLEIPEWGDEDGKPAEVYFAPVTLRQRQKLNARAGDNNPGRTLALAVILFARKADGSPLFPDTAATLKSFENEVDPAVLARIGVAMLGTSEADDLGN